MYKKYKLNKYRFLGKLCIKGHRHNNTNKSLRYKTRPKGCVVCNAISSKKRMEAGKIKEWRKANPDKILAYREKYKGRYDWGKYKKKKKKRGK